MNSTAAPTGKDRNQRNEQMTNTGISIACAVVALCADVAEQTGIIGYWPAVFIAASFVLIAGYYMNGRRRKT